MQAGRQVQRQDSGKNHLRSGWKDWNKPLYNCVVCFSQIYDQNLSLHRIRDYDNLEFKQILDTIAAYVLVDDTGLLCDSYHTTELGTHDHTIVSIMDCEAFPGWIKSRQKYIRTISEIS